MRNGGSRVPVILIVGFAGLLLIVGGALAWQMGRAGSGAAGPAVLTSPKLVVDRDVIDFGQVPFNKRVQASFKLSNAGGKPLQIVGEPRVEVVKGC